MVDQNITIRSRKYDLSIRRTWTCKLIGEHDGFLSSVGKFEFDVEHPGLGSIRRGTLSYEFYWLDRWYNIFRFHEPDGSFRNYYCNVSMPPTYENGVLDYVDLDIDVIVWKDFSYEVVDRDDFEQNAVKYGYTSGIRNNAEGSLAELIRLIEKREFPFSMEY